MVGCSIISCKSNNQRKEAGVTFHAFPKEEEARRIWIARTGKKNWMPHKYSRVCSKHFEESCFHRTPRQTFLNMFSIPTYSIPAECEDIKTEPDPLEQHLNVTVNSSIPACEDIKTEPVPLAQHHIVTVKSSIPAETKDIQTQTETPASHRYVIIKSPIPAETKDIQTQTETPASHHYVTVKSPIPAECKDAKPVPHHNVTDKTIKTEPIMTPKEGQLLLKLNRQKIVSEDRHKKIEALRSKNRRLEKKNAELMAIIQDFKKRP